MPETPKEKIENAESKGISGLLSPSALMLLPAVLLDLVGLLLAIFGVTEILSYFTDFLGLIIIGAWTYFRSQEAKVTAGAEKRLTNLTKWAKRLRWLRPLLIVLEFVPFVGAAPNWTLLVIFELMS